MGFIRHRQVPEQVFPKLPMGGFKGFEDVSRYLTSLLVALRNPSDPTTLAARATRSTDQTLTTAVVTAISFNAAAKNNGGLWISTNPTRLTAVISGWYQISAGLEFDVNATGGRRMELWLNGTTVIGKSRIAAPAAGNATLVASVLYPLSVNDYVELKASQSSGGDLTVLAVSDYSPFLSMVMLFPVQE